MKNKTRFIIFNLGFDTLLSLVGVYFLGFGIVLAADTLSLSAPYLLTLIVWALVAVCVGVGIAILWAVLPAFKADLQFLGENGLPKD